MAHVAADEASALLKRPLVSCVMTTWNGERYLRQAIDSALAQDYSPLEVVVVDDGSTDATAAICRSYGDRIRYIRQPKDDKRGATAVVRAYAEARGVYLAPLDHDDVWLPGKISRQVATFQAAPDAGAVFTKFREIDADSQDQGISTLVGLSGDVFHALLENNSYCYSSSMFSHAALRRVGHHDVDAGIGDWDLWLRIARYYPFVMLDEVLTEYRVHDGGYSIGRVNMIIASERVINNQTIRIHKDCLECKRAMRRQRDHLASDWLAHMVASIKNKKFRMAIEALAEAWRLAPGSILYWTRAGISMKINRSPTKNDR